MGTVRRKGVARPGMLALQGLLHGALVHILISSGARESFIHKCIAKTLRLKQQRKPQAELIQLANGSKQLSESKARVQVHVDGASFACYRARSLR
jgi:hypothetical protein